MLLRILVARLITSLHLANFFEFLGHPSPFHHVPPPSPSSSIAQDDASYDHCHVNGWSRLSAFESE